MAGVGGARDAEADEEGIQTVVNFGKNLTGLMKKLFV
jgi:hypothetical protein